MIFPDGSKYIGEWKYGLKNGQGIEISHNGKKWVGEYKDGNTVNELSGVLGYKTSLPMKKSGINSQY